MKLLHSRPYILAEMVTLTVILPLAIFYLHALYFRLPCIWAAMLYCLAVGRATGIAPLRECWRGRAVRWPALRPVLLRFFVLSAVIMAGTALWQPERLFSFVRAMPWFWALVMLLYPLLSVVAQEVIYRWFFMARYAALFPSARIMILASAVAFAFGHVIFNNWVAPMLCLFGGAIFAATYARHRSLALVSLEHALYGDAVYTIGLGMYFYHGAG